MPTITKVLNSIIPTNLTKPSTAATIVLGAAIIASLANLTFAAFKTAPLWAPPLAASGPLGWTVLASTGIILTTALLVLKIKNKKIGEIPKIQELPPMTKIAPSQFSSAINATHSGNLDTNVVDFSFASEHGIGYVADNSGHNKPNGRLRRQETFNHFNEQLVAFLKEKSTYTTQELKEVLRGLSQKEDVYGSTTFSLAAIVQIDNKKHAVIFSMGDSSIYIYNKDNEFQHQIRENEHAEFSDPYRFDKTNFTTIPLKEGDKILGVTDGVTDFMSKEKIDSALASCQDDAATFLNSCQTIITSGQGNGEFPYDLNGKNGTDDLGAFILRV